MSSCKLSAPKRAGATPSCAPCRTSTGPPGAGCSASALAELLGAAAPSSLLLPSSEPSLPLESSLLSSALLLPPLMLAACWAAACGEPVAPDGTCPGRPALAAALAFATATLCTSAGAGIRGILEAAGPAEAQTVNTLQAQDCLAWQQHWPLAGPLWAHWLELACGHPGSSCPHQDTQSLPHRRLSPSLSVVKGTAPNWAALRCAANGAPALGAGQKHSTHQEPHWRCVQGSGPGLQLLRWPPDQRPSQESELEDCWRPPCDCHLPGCCWKGPHRGCCSPPRCCSPSQCCCCPPCCC